MDDNLKNRINELVTGARDIADPAERSRKYKAIIASISVEMVRSNELSYIEEAKKIAALVTDDPSKGYLEIIRAIAKLKRKDKSIFDGAIEIAAKIDNDLELSVALHEISVAYAGYGIENQDKALYSECLALAKRIPMDTYRSMAFRNVSKALAGRDAAKALELLEISIEIIEKSKCVHKIYHVRAFCEIASGLAILKDDRCYGFMERARTLADEITDDFDRSAALLKILETDIEMGNILDDKTLLEEAMLVSKRIPKEYYKTLASNALKSIK